MSGKAFSGIGENFDYLGIFFFVKSVNVRFGVIENYGIKAAFRKKPPKAPVYESGGYARNGVTSFSFGKLR